MSRSGLALGQAGGPPADRVFAGPGALRALCREQDWAATPLGPVEGWSASLRSAAQLVLASGLPNILLWGRSLTQIYNDTYAELIGSKHPYALGRGNEHVWPEVWHINGPIFDRVFQGETVTNWDAHYPLERAGGQREDVYLTVSFSPVLDDDGTVGGVLANMIETTHEVAARVFSSEREELLATIEGERARLEAIFRDAPSFLAVVRGRDHVFTHVNDAYCTLVGRRDVLGRKLFDALPEVRGQGFEELMGRVLDTGEPAVFREREVHLDRFGSGMAETRYIDLAYYPLIDPDGTRAGVIAHGVDITEQVLARRQVASLLSAERSARARTEHMQQVAADLSAARTPLEVAAVTLGAGLRELRLQRGSLYEVDRSSPTAPMLVAVHHVGYDADVVERWGRYPLDASTLAGDVVLRGEPIMLRSRAEAIERYPALAPVLETTPYRGGVAFPLIATETASGNGRHSTIGFVAFDFDAEGGLGDSDMRFLRALSHLCAQALERTRLFQAEQRALEAADRERRHLATLIDAIPVMVTVYEPALAERAASIQFNRAFVDTLGWSVEDAKHHNIMELCYPDSDVRDSASRHMQAPGVHWLEIPTRTRDGRTIPVLWSNVRLSDEMQVGVGVDLTERKAAEAAVERERALLEAILNQMPVGVSIAEAPSGRLFYTNPEGERLLGHPAVPTEDMRAYPEHYGALHEDGTPYQAHEFPLARGLVGEFVDQHLMLYRRGDGSITHLAVSAAPVYDAHGNIVRAVGTFTDVAERIRLEEELRRTMEDAERANRSKSEFLAAMSHELRTPLNAIAGYVDLLELGVHGALSDAQSASVERIRINSRHLTSLINDILQFAKVEVGALELHVKTVPLAETLQELEGMVLPQIIRKGLRAKFEACEPGLACRADPDRLRQILLNLVGNAIKFTDANGELRVESRREGNQVHITVRDTGRGIAAEQQERIFEPFVQLDRSRVESSQQGVGLGLAISRDLARSMHGDITVRSEPDQGSAFTISLPAAG